MKKWVMFGLLGVCCVVGVMAVMSFMGVRANEGALEEIRGQEGVVVLSVAGMT
ncbi:MAG: hypothetical protein AAF581_03890 [Planctomycetota bacterium]